MFSPKLQRRQRRKIPKSQSVTASAPVGGWNTRDALDAMPAADAVTLDNWFPTTGKVKVRPGYTEYVGGTFDNALFGATEEEGEFGSTEETMIVGSTDSVGDVETLVEYHAGTTRKLICAANNNIYDVNSGGFFSSIGNGYSNNRWQTVNFNGRLFMVNGQNSPLDYDGTTLNVTTWTGSGLSPSSLYGVNVFKNRLYFWSENEQDFWYGTPNGVSGALTQFPLSRVGGFGGNLVAMGTWTLDGGDGVDDYAVFIMSSGEAIVYSGSDPGDASDWALVGVYRMSAPLDVRGVVKVGSDLMIMTRDDFVSLSSVLNNGQLGTATKLSGAVQDASSNASLFGWQAVIHKADSMILFNVPSAASAWDQYVINATTGAACRFKDIPARCWAVYNNELYFGGDGAVYKYGSAQTDNGAAINADGRSAWQSFGGSRARVAAIRPVIESQGSVDIEVGTGFDFNDALVTSPSTTEVAGSEWDESAWDVSLWSDEVVASHKWGVAKGTGYTLSTRLKVAGKQEISWVRTDYRLEQSRGL